MLGPMLLHQRKTFDTYNFFFSNLVGLNKEVSLLLAFGTDGEDALIQALSRSFYHALHLRCFGHFKDNCKEQLKSVPQEVQAEFLADVFDGERSIYVVTFLFRQKWLVIYAEEILNNVKIGRAHV